MKFYDFIIYVLAAHANTLDRLADLFGENVVVEVLESLGDREDLPQFETPDPRWLTPPRSFEESDPGLAYEEIQLAVKKFRLKERLEFYLWVYPPYRSLIESSIDLDSTVHSPELIEQSLRAQEQWLATLPLPPAIMQEAKSAAQAPWTRFRVEALKRLGKRPLGPAY